MAILSANATEQLANFIEAESKAWVEEYITLRKGVLAKRGILATGGLQDSFEYDQTKDASNPVSNTLELAFSDYGRFVEMKRLNIPGGGTEFIDGLAAWIVKKGLEARMTRDFMAKRNLRKPPADVLTQIAWSMAIKRKQRYRPRPWYTKSKSAALTDLFNRVADGVPDIVIEELKASFKNTL